MKLTHLTLKEEQKQSIQNIITRHSSSESVHNLTHAQTVCTRLPPLESLGMRLMNVMELASYRIFCIHSYHGRVTIAYYPSST